jgi:hypothetical protein
MTKSTLSDNRKKRIGRPPVGAILIGVRVPPADVAVLDAWIKKSEPGLSRPEAIRRLVELGLTVRTKPKQAPAARAARAKELAANAIDKMSDPAAHPEEHAQRRRRLTKGPEEFREVRVDRHKAKGSPK